MSYAGSMKEIRFGQFGIVSDLASDAMPDGGLIRCENGQFLNGIVEKAEEISDWVRSNPTYSTPTFTTEKPIANHRYFPFPREERQIVVTDAGVVYKYTSPFLRTALTAETSSDPTTLSISGMPVIATGGNEVQGNAKKVFIYTGNSQVQVMEADEDTRRSITNPAADWSSTFPTYGLIFRSKHACIMGHTLYLSPSTDHEDFRAATSGVQVIQCFPGEGEGIISAFIYKTKLFVFKAPYGVYVLNDTDTDPDNWFFQKSSGSFGIASPQSFFEATDDYYVMSNDGTVISMTAALRMGDIYNADLLSASKNSVFFRAKIRNQYLNRSFGAYLPKKKIGVFGFASYTSSGGYCDSLVYIDFNGDVPRISWHRYKNTEFASCHYFRDPYSDDKFLFTKHKYSSGSYTTGVMGTYYPSYSSNTPFRLQTPHSNLGVPANKLFDGFELIFESGAVYPLAVDVYVDSKYSERFLIQPFYGDALGPAFFSISRFANPLFLLGTDSLVGRGTRPKWHSLHARGHTISFVIRDGNVIDSPYTGAPNADDDLGSALPVKIAGIRVYYRVAGQDQKSQSS